MNHEYTVTVYSQPSCGPCIAAKKWFKTGGVDFVECDITQSPEAAELLRSLGYGGTPVVIVTDSEGRIVRHHKDYRPAEMNEIKQLLSED